MKELEKTAGCGGHIGNSVASVRQSANEIIDYVTELERRVSTLEEIVRILVANKKSHLDEIAEEARQKRKDHLG